MGEDPSPNPPTAADYPRIYRIRTGWRFAMAGFALAFFGLAGALWYFEMGDGAENPDLRLIMFGILAIPLLMGSCSLPYAIGARPFLILNLDSVQLQGIFLKRRLLRQEIAGYRIHNQGYSLYEIILEPKNEQDKPVKISSVLYRDDVLNTWLELQSLTDLDLVDEQAAIAEIAADPTLGATPEERLERLENARLVGLASSFVGYSVAGWALFFPQPYDIAMGVAAFLPWIAVVLLAVWPHMFRLDGKQKDQHVQLFGLFYVPGFALLIRVILDIDVMDWRMPVAAGLIAGACMASFALLADRGAPFRLGTLVAVFFLMLPYGYGATQFANRFFDKAAPQQFLATVQGKHVNRGKLTTYQIELGAWGPHEGPNEILVSKADYEQLGTRNAVCVRVGPGALNMAYQYLVHSSWCAAEAKAPVGSQKGNMGPRSILSEFSRPVETT